MAGEVGRQTVIVRAKLADREQCESVLRSAFAPYVHRLGRKQTDEAYSWLPDAISDQRVIKAEIQGDIVGVAICTDEANARHIDQIAVSPTVQGQGIGSALLLTLEQDAFASKLSILELETAEMMTHLLRLYQSHGFEIIDRGPPKHSLDEHTRVYMRKAITVSGPAI